MTAKKTRSARKSATSRKPAPKKRATAKRAQAKAKVSKKKAVKRASVKRASVKRAVARPGSAHSLRFSAAQFFAACQSGDFEGPGRTTRAQANADALAHQRRHPGHVVDVIIEQ